MLRVAGVGRVYENENAPLIAYFLEQGCETREVCTYFQKTRYLRDSGRSRGVRGRAGRHPARVADLPPVAVRGCHGPGYRGHGREPGRVCALRGRV